MFAISYDPIDTLARFSEVHGIEYPLLADIGSEVITSLGVLNVTMEQERAAYGRKMEDRHRGVPYPGSFLIDEAGILTGKRFEQSHRIRPTGRTLLSELGESGAPPEVSADASSEGVNLVAWLDTAVVHANQLQNLNVTIELEPDVHLYTQPVPEGFTELTVSLDGPDRLQVEPISLPAGSEFHVEGLPETFFVLEGRIELKVPFFLLSNRDTAGDETVDAPLTLNVSYQACTASACFMPERIEIPLPLQEAPNPGYESADQSVVSPLVFRRIVEKPRTATELLDLVNVALEGTDVSLEVINETIENLAQGGFIHLANDLWERTV